MEIVKLLSYLKKKLCLFVIVMRIGKKSKDSEAKSQCIEGISRLICTATTKAQLLTGKSLCLDHVE